MGASALEDAARGGRAAVLARTVARKFKRQAEEPMPLLSNIVKMAVKPQPDVISPKGHSVIDYMTEQRLSRGSASSKMVHPAR